MTIAILYEDNHLLVLNKPSGLLTQPSGTDQDSLEQRAKAWIKQTYHKPGNVFLEAVHRLDKSVSGVVVFGKTSKAVSRLNEAMRDKNSQKIYLALVEGHPPASEGILENYLIHDDYQAKIVPKNNPQGKTAILKYKILKAFQSTTLLEIELITGRYHQIRVQLAHIGCPIVGDYKYGAKTPFIIDSIALHHQKISLPHPITKKWMAFEAPLPTFWTNLQR